MKLRCPRCQSKIEVPDTWAGRSIRCRGCNKAFRVPRPTATIAPAKADAGLNLEDLASLERGTEALDERDRSELEHQMHEAADASGRSGTRTCPHCGKEVAIKDPYAESLCSFCWEPIPALIGGGAGGKGPSGPAVPPFYAGLVSAFTYPFGAIGSLATGVLVAIVVVLLPVAGSFALAFTVEQGRAGLASASEPLYFASLEKAFIGFVAAEMLFFLGVGVHALLEAIRATAVGTQKPPELVWNPSQWGSSILAYLALIAYYAVFMLVALWLSSRGGFEVPTTLAALRERLTPVVLLLAGLFTFVVPMHLIGIATSSVIRGLNPVNVAKSIAATHVNYVFLFLLVAVYGTLFGLAASAVGEWFGGVLLRTAREAGAGNVAQTVAGLLSWGAVIGFGFYGIYLLGRLHGLFAQSFRRQLAFFD